MGNEFLPLLYSFHFYLFGLIAIASALAFVTRKSPVAAALWLILIRVVQRMIGSGDKVVFTEVLRPGETFVIGRKRSD